MARGGVHLTSLDRVVERIVGHLKQDHHTALVGSPGCGATTFLAALKGQLADAGFELVHLDARALELPEFLSQINALQPVPDSRRVVVLDHTGDLLSDDFRHCLCTVQTRAEESGSLCLWCGPLDARNVERNCGVRLCSVPSAHVSFPMLPRDERLSVYRMIAEERDCRWGEAILYLMLDFCGSDLSLVAGATDYFHGDWSDRLYDATVWDRIADWCANDRAVDGYRRRLRDLPEGCKSVLALVRFGGKPRCLRAEIFEEVDDALRRLCLGGFLVQNLLPGFYQLRNLTVKFLLDEAVAPELLFRRATNERAAQLLQDAETMLRQVLAWGFERIGIDAVRERLERMQQPSELISGDLNRDILKWARDNCLEETVTRLNDLILKHRKAFKEENSVWAGALRMLREDGVEINGTPQLRCIDYLTFDQLGRLVVDLMDDLFPNVPQDDLKKRQLKERWSESLSKVRRLRNRVAHLRNVGFQDMEDLAGTLEGMRGDMIEFGGWKPGL